ncbi:hypothetical protein BC835DRAFT_1399660 [Cytidiella melzeri]|nr:hypothetical protein BC835DRAFT_1399660 [Cytidiella melzeri]
MRLSTSFILAAVMLTSTIHMVPVSAFPHSSTAPSHHATLFSNHHTLVRREELTQKQYDDYFTTLANIGGVPHEAITLALEWAAEIQKKHPDRYAQMVLKWNGGQFAEDHFNAQEKSVLKAVEEISRIRDEALAKGPIMFQSGGRIIIVSRHGDGQIHFEKA